MLSRSQSIADNRLHRSKSTASAHTEFSGHHRSSTSIDPFTTRQQAEAAAVEAYHRMRQLDESLEKPYKPAPSRSYRRRSQITGRTEGSHFEDARLGRRQSGSKKDDHFKFRPAQSNDLPKTQRHVTSDPTDGARVITRRRSVIPPDPANLQSQHGHYHLPASSGRPARKSQAEFTRGSPAPRNALTPSHQNRSQLQLQTPQVACYQATALEPENFKEFDESCVANCPPPSLKRPSIRETQTDEEILAVARDKCLQDFRHRSLRQRKSFLAAPFQRRRTETPNTGSKIDCDRFFPPLNNPGDSAGTASILQLDPEHSSIPITTLEKKSRNFTATIKSRFQKVIGKSSRTLSGVPIQHIEAQHFHYSIRDPASFEGLGVERERTLNSKPVQEEPRSRMVSEDVPCGSGRSRVTSWTNSTVEAASLRPDPSIRAEAVDTPSVRQQNSGTIVNLRRAGSIIGNSARNRLRKRSKAELNISEESQGLFSALKARLKSTSSPEAETISEKPSSLRTTSALSSLPSQQNSVAVQREKLSIIRTITPVPPCHRVSVPSPVKEVNSPPRTSDVDDEHAPKMFQPSGNQLARRLEKTHNRWQTQLDELSPPLVAPPVFDDPVEDNPYELPSLKASYADPSPLHKKQYFGIETPRAEMLSPSLYSRATDGASRVDTPDDQGGTIVTITGREVRSYSISPKKRRGEPLPVQASGEWRRWLSGELHGFHEQAVDYAMPALFDTMAAREQQEKTGASRIEMNKTARPQSPTGIPPNGEVSKPARSNHPRTLSSRRSSFMNERYPMLDTTRDSNEKSVRSHRVSSAESKSGHGRQAAPSVPTTATSIKQLHSAKSIAQIPLVGHVESTRRHEETLSQSNQTSDEAGALQVNKLRREGLKNASRPRSAFELRAQYRTGNASTSRSVEVHRKTAQTSKGTRNTIDIEDNTIQDISAGPYAPRDPSRDVGANKENSPLAKTDNNCDALPAIASSEWLAAGSSKSRRASIAPLSLSNGSAGRYSPVRSSPSGKYSPAQKMATEFLEKRSRGNTPAFM